MAHHEEAILITQNNLAMTYGALGRDEEALRLKLDVYSGHLKLHGEEHPQTLIAANNYARPLSLPSASKKPRHSCAEQCPWRCVLGDSVRYPAQDEIGITRRRICG